MLNESYDFDAIVLGAGHNGLTAAAYLGRAGLKVLVLERRANVGGACSTEELFPGFRFSSCAYICHLLQEKVIEDLELRKHGFRVYPLDPVKFSPFPDGRALLIWDDIEKSQEAIAAFSRQDAKAYPRWLDFWRRASGIIYPYFLTCPPTLEELAIHVQGTRDESTLNTLLTLSMTDLVTDFFESEYIQGSFIQAQDVGDPNVKGSALCYALQRCDIFSNPESTGIVHGGMGSITQAMRRAAETYGVDIRTGAQVKKIVVAKKQAQGVQLDDDQIITSRVVLSNADPKRTFLNLISSEDLDPHFRSQIEGLRTHAAYLKFHASLKELPDFSRYLQGISGEQALAMIKICPSIEYYQKSWNDAHQGRPAENPVMEVQIPTVFDRSLVDGDGHVMSVWGLYAPVSPAGTDWPSIRQEVGNSLINTLSTYAPNLHDAILDWSLFTPDDLSQRVALTDGNIRHIDIVPSQFLSQRPLKKWSHYRTPVDGLFLCGAGCHPGGEVTAAPGHNAAHEVLKHWNH